MNPSSSLLIQLCTPSSFAAANRQDLEQIPARCEKTVDEKNPDAPVYEKLADDGINGARLEKTADVEKVSDVINGSRLEKTADEPNGASLAKLSDITAGKVLNKLSDDSMSGLIEKTADGLRRVS